MNKKKIIIVVTIAILLLFGIYIYIKLTYETRKAVILLISESDMTVYMDDMKYFLAYKDNILITNSKGKRVSWIELKEGDIVEITSKIERVKKAVWIYPIPIRYPVKISVFN